MIVLEPAAQALADATAKPPFLVEPTPAQARKVLDDLQAGPIEARRRGGVGGRARRGP